MLKRNKKNLIRILLICSILILLWLYWGNYAIEITKFNVESQKIPDAFNGFTIVQISDLHNAKFGENQNKLLSKINIAKPDLIAVTGDLIDSNRTGLEMAMEFINQAVEIAPVYYVTGNHEASTEEYTELEEKLKLAGVIILNDQTITLESGSSEIQLIGLADPHFSVKENSLYDGNTEIDAKLKRLLEKNKGYKILLSHRPELMDIYVQNSVDLVLAGHAHGGQFRIPFIGGLIAPNQGLFPQYSEGIYEKEQTRMIVSRGLGNSIIPIRINNRPELVVITLLSAL